MKFYAKPGITAIQHKGVDYVVRDGVIEFTSPITPHDIETLKAHGFTDKAPETPVKTDAEIKGDLIARGREMFGVNLDRRKSVAALQAELDALAAEKAKGEE